MLHDNCGYPSFCCGKWPGCFEPSFPARRVWPSRVGSLVRKINPPICHFPFQMASTCHWLGALCRGRGSSVGSKCWGFVAGGGSPGADGGGTVAGPDPVPVNFYPLRGGSNLLASEPHFQTLLWPKRPSTRSRVSIRFQSIQPNNQLIFEWTHQGGGGPRRQTVPPTPPYP